MKQAVARRAAGAVVAARRRWPTPSTSKIHGRDRGAGRGSAHRPGRPSRGRRPWTAATRRPTPTIVGAPRRVVAGRVHRRRRPRVRASRSCRWRRAPAGARRVLDVGCGEGQVARLAVERRRHAGSSGVDPRRPRSPRPGAGAAGGRPTSAAVGHRAAVRGRVVRRGGGLPGVRAHRRRSTARSPRWAGCCDPAAGSCSSSTTRCCRRPGSGWIDDQILDPPEQYWRIGPYLTRP